MKEPIKLDKWDSQILLLSKGWFEKELKELGKSDLDALKALWTDRCYVELEHVRIYHLVSKIVEMMERFGVLNEKTVTQSLMESLTYTPDYNRYGFKRDEEVSREEDIIDNLLSKISQVAVREDTDEGYRDLITLEELDRSFLDVFTRVEDEGIKV